MSDLKCKCGKEGIQHFVGIEYPYDHVEHYDGISEWRCMACGQRYGRWTGRELTGAMTEPRYGMVNGVSLADWNALTQEERVRRIRKASNFGGHNF